MADRNLFPGDQTAPAHQILHWHHRKRCHDSNLDGIDYHPYPEGVKGDGKAPVVPVQPGRIYPSKSVCEDRSPAIAGLPL